MRINKLLESFILISAAATFPCLFAGALAPSTYTAISDTNPRPKPALPVLNGAGTVVVDPTFGTRILRVTDSGTRTNSVSASYRTPVNGWMNNWNADGTMFWVTSTGVSAVPFKFNAATMTATRVPNPSDPSGGLILPFSGPFSFQKPNILYGGVSHTIVAYDFSTNKSTTVFDADKAVPGVSGPAYAVSVSDDDSKLCMPLGSASGAYTYIVVLDRNTGTYHVLDMMKSLVDGKKNATTLGYTVHSAYIERSGRYVIIKDGSNRPSTAWTVWDVQSQTAYAITGQADGNNAAGFGVRVNQSGYTDSFTDDLEWSLRSLPATAIAAPQYLIDPATLPSPHLTQIYDGRLSWNNAQANNAVPAIGSISRDDRQATQPWRTWDDEIIAIATDGSGKVWRFAHHRSLWDTNVQDVARGNVSQDGRWYMFTSNWERTLGTDSSDGTFRQDVFIVELNRPSASPTVSLTAPAAGATVGGTVTLSATADCPDTVSGVQFFLDGTSVAPELTTAPYTLAWDSSTASPGPHTLTAVARSPMGPTTTSTPVGVTVAAKDNIPPQVEITSPASGTLANGAVSITAVASDESALKSVAIYVDGAILISQPQSPVSAQWNSAGAKAGAHVITAIAMDANGNAATSAPVTVTIPDTTPPTVEITTPAGGASLSGAVAVSAGAQDDVGVAGVQFLANGGPIGAEVTTAPFSVQWSTTGVPNGTYVFTARARDAAGNTTTSAPVSATVNNIIIPAPPAPTLTAPANNATATSTTQVLRWNAASNATSYMVYLGTTAPPPLAATVTTTSYATGTLSAGTTYYWSVTAANNTGSSPSAVWQFTTATSAIGQTGTVLSYTSPYCGPSGGSPAWACGAWPTTTPPTLGPAGTTTVDPDTFNRVLRVTQSGSFGEDASSAFKIFDSGWKQAWNAASNRFFLVPWAAGPVKHPNYWIGFNPDSMSLNGTAVPVPVNFTDLQWDQNDPDLIVGIADGVAKSYNVVTQAWTTVFDPATTNWGARPWISAWGGNSVCIAEGMQDVGYRIACMDRSTSTTSVINLRAQTINGSPFTVYFQGKPVTLPSSIGNHTVTMGLDGNWLAIDTHGNSLCSTPGLSNYASTSLMINLQTNTGYEFNTACGGTHWAYGYNGVMMQSVSPKWTNTNNNSPCNSDSRGIARRNSDLTIDSSFYLTQPCSFFNNNTWNINVHLSWLNNANDANVNNYPVLVSTTNEGVGDMFLWSDIAAMQTAPTAYQGRLWRFAQTWNDQTSNQCGFLIYSSPAISPDGRWAVFPSDWHGQTGSNGVCTNGKRTDVFLFELR